LQVGFPAGEGLGQRPERAGRHTSLAGGGKLGSDVLGQRPDLGERPLDVASNAGVGVGGLAGGELGVLAALQRKVEGKAVVACGHGVVGLFQRIGGGRVLDWSVQLGAGRSGRVDGALCLVHFLAWRLVAPHREKRRKTPRREPPPVHTN
jgi:hypothetical protein